MQRFREILNVNYVRDLLKYFIEWLIYFQFRSPVPIGPGLSEIRIWLELTYSGALVKTGQEDRRQQNRKKSEHYSTPPAIQRIEQYLGFVFMPAVHWLRTLYRIPLWNNTLIRRR